MFREIPNPLNPSTAKPGANSSSCVDPIPGVRARQLAEGQLYPGAAVWGSALKALVLVLVLVVAAAACRLRDMVERKEYCCFWFYNISGHLLHVCMHACKHVVCCMYVCMYACTQCVDIYIYIYTCKSINEYMYMYVYDICKMHVCICIYTVDVCIHARI